MSIWIDTITEVKFTMSMGPFRGVWRPSVKVKGKDLWFDLDEIVIVNVPVRNKLEEMSWEKIEFHQKIRKDHENNKNVAG